MSAPRTRRACVVMATSALALSAVGLVQAAPADAATTCPKATGATIAFTTTLSNGLLKVGRATSTGGSATACGLLVSAGGGKIKGVIQQGNITFAPSTTKLGLLSLPTTIRATSPLTGPVAFTSAGQTASLGGSVVATADILGSKCDIPLKVRLTTGRSGALTGTTFTPDGTGSLAGKLVANNFAVPAISVSETCNFLVALGANALLGLPLAAGESSITYDATLKLG